MKNGKLHIEPWMWSALLSGALLAVSFPTLNLFPLAWVALAPLLTRLYDLDSRQAFRAGLLFGIVYFFGTTYWIYHSVYHYGGMPLIPSVCLVLVLCCYLALYPAICSVLISRFLRETPLPALLLAPLFWTVGEFVRSYAFTGFPWSSIAYSQYQFLPVIQIADVVGVYGVSFLVVAVNGAIADALLIRRRRADKPLFPYMPTVVGAAVLGITLIAVLGYGAWRMHQDRSAGSVLVAIVQGNIEQDKKWDAAFREYSKEVYRGLSREAAKAKPDLIVWPESAVPFVFGRDKAETADLVAFQKELDAYLLLGAILKRDPKADNYTNGAALLSRDGSLSYLYDKIHLVPFGEYVPLKSVLFFVDKLAYGIGDYVPGDSYVRAVTPFGSFATLICYESIFPGLTRKFYVRGGDFLVIVTNDAWFGTTNGPYQHFSMAVFRAIETRKTVVRAANSGISGVIDSTGRIGPTTALMTRGVLSTTIQNDKTITPYTKYGDIFCFVCIAASVVLFFGRRRF